MKGVIFAGGMGSRLKPFTNVVDKSILPVYDKPAIYFPVSSLVNAGIEDIVINTHNPEHIQAVLSGERFPANISYHTSKEPQNVAAVLHDMRGQIKDVPILTMLGDIYLPFQIEPPDGLDDCCIYVSTTYAPSRISEYGVAQLNQNNEVLTFDEKPKNPRGKYVHMGTTFFPADLTYTLGQMEAIKGKDLTDVANMYLNRGRLIAKVYDQQWFNVGTPEDLFLASCYRRQSKKSHCAVVILEDEHGQFLLYLRDNKPDIAFPNTWALIAGLVKEGETPEDAIRREAKEELKNRRDLSDYVLQELKFLFDYPRADMLRDEHVFHASLKTSIEDLISNEGQGLRIFDRETIIGLDNIAPHHREILLKYIMMQRTHH